MAGWFTPRPPTRYRARWLGDNLAQLEADPLLPVRLTFTVLGGGDLRVADPVLGRQFDVPVGTWFDETQAWPLEQLDAYEQVLPGAGPWAYWITGGELPAVSALAARADDLEDAVAALESGVGVLAASVTHLEFGQANVSGALLANATVDVTVTWTTALPVTTYQVRLVSLASGLLGSLTLDSIVARTTTQCTVRLRAGALLTLSGSVVLAAYCVT